MDLVSVAHGPSLKGKGLGRKIDRFDTVVRIAGVQGQTPEDHGTRTDYSCSCLPYISDFIIDGIKAKEYWLFSRPGVFTEERMEQIRNRMGKLPFICCVDEVDRWNQYFVSLGPRVRPDQRGQVISRGLAAVIIAAERLRPERIVMAGYDNLWAGTNDNYITLASKKVDPYPAHDMETERKVLDAAQRHYGFTLERLD